MPDLDTTVLVVLAACWAPPLAIGGTIAWQDLRRPQPPPSGPEPVMPQAGTRRRTRPLVDDTVVLPPVWHDEAHAAAPWWAGAEPMPAWAEQVGHGWHDATRRAHRPLPLARGRRVA